MPSTSEFGEGPNADLMRQFVGLMDEYQSKENAKHTLRGMEENARQGFVNGIPPFGYRAVVAENRGAKVKKRLEIEPDEAEIVKLMWHLAKTGPTGADSVGVRTIAKELSRRNLTTRSGRPFSSTEVHRILHSTTYIGRHVFNMTDSHTRKKKPPDKWIIVSVPPMIDEVTFEAVHAAMRERDPMRVAVRFTGRPTLLSRLARCATCGGAMTLRTGKSARYRYYTCSTAYRFSHYACPGRNIRESLLDGLVIDHLSDVLFELKRLRAVIEDAIEAEHRAQDGAPRQLDGLLRRKADLETRVGRMHQAIERGLIDFDDAEFARRLKGLKGERAEIELQIASLRSTAVEFPALTSGSIRAFSARCARACGLARHATAVPIYGSSSTA
jgi:site-specific DNA recombinase